MNQRRMTETSLFELLARQWDFDEEIEQVEFNATDTAVMLRLRSGKLALVTTDDVESTKSRTRIDVESGRTTIQRRKKPIAKTRFAPIKVKANSPVVRLGSQGFLAIDHAGSPHQITAGAQSIEKFGLNNSEISTLCGDQRGDVFAISQASGTAVYLSEKMELLRQLDSHRKIENMAFCAQGKKLAIFGEGCLDIIDTKDGEGTVKEIRGLKNVSQLTWDAKGRYIACASSEKSFHIIDTDAETFHTVADYPSSVKTVAFSETGNALLTSGAFRVAGWSTEDLPSHGNLGTPLTTGKAGLTLVNTIAAHPSRNLVAVGYANGLVTITSIGSTQEMMVHHETETEIRTLSWSNSGEHLAIGFGSGKAALVTFPENLFK